VSFSTHLLPPPARLCSSPQLTTLALLDCALDASEAALGAAHYELGFHSDQAEGPHTVVLAAAILRHSKRLAIVLAEYRAAVHRQGCRTATRY
jgi:hypothetical protein